MQVNLSPLPMSEAQKFWADKVKFSPGEFAKLSKEAKLRAFAVSGIAKGDELDTVFKALQRAIDDGISFDQFKKECGDIFERRGWTGKRAWRVDNIFRTNIQTAYNVGHYKQLQEDADIFPYWQYSAINDSRTRPTHLAMDDRVWPADHPVWDNWFPPNGYRCRCSVIGITKGQAEARGLKIEEKDITNRLIEPIDPGTGNKMPAVQMLPDQGFGINPGKSYWQPLTPAELPGEMTLLPIVKQELKEISADHIVTVSAADILPAGLKDEEYVRSFLAEFGLKDIEEHLLHQVNGKGSPQVMINKYLFIDRKTGEWKITKAGRERYIKLLAQTIINPYEVWLVPTEISGKMYTAVNMIRLFELEEEKLGGFCMFSLVGGSWQSTTAFMPNIGKEGKMFRYLEKQRMGKLLYREEL